MTNDHRAIIGGPAKESTGDSAAGPIAPRGALLVALGGVLAAIGATSCCVLPFTLVMAGAGGAWLGGLTALAPYQPIFVGSALALLAAGFVTVYRRPRVACAPGSYCAKPTSHRIAKIGLWTGSVLVLAALTFPYLARLVLDV
jgi:mercuric ion transport protein